MLETIGTYLAIGVSAVAAGWLAGNLWLWLRGRRSSPALSPLGRGQASACREPVAPGKDCGMPVFDGWDYCAAHRCVIAGCVRPRTIAAPRLHCALHAAQVQAASQGIVSRAMGAPHFTVGSGTAYQTRPAQAQRSQWPGYIPPSGSAMLGPFARPCAEPSCGDRADAGYWCAAHHAEKWGKGRRACERFECPRVVTETGAHYCDLHLGVHKLALPSHLRPRMSDVAGPLYGWRRFRLHRTSRSDGPVWSTFERELRGIGAWGEAFAAGQDVYILGGVFRLWGTPSMRAECNQAGDLAPRRYPGGPGETIAAREHLEMGECHCGIYVLRHPDVPASGVGSEEDQVLALCEIEGVCVEHDLGWRAEKVTIRKLLFGAAAESVRRDVAQIGFDLIRNMGGGIELHVMVSQGEWSERLGKIMEEEHV